MELGFILKKLISIAIMPLSITLFILFLGIVLLYLNKIRISKIILTLGIFTLCLFSYNPVANTLINNLEKQYPQLENIPEGVEHILLLGGDFESRAWEVLKLYNKNKNLKIITSGYEGVFEIPEAIRSANILLELGIVKENIIIHSKPKDTREEAIAMKNLLQDKPFILVTAAYHMPRAMALFQKEGTKPIAAPAGFLEKKKKFFSFPYMVNLEKTTIAIHEYIGLLWAKLRGQI